MKTTDELAALIEERTGAISKTMQNMADEVQTHGRRLTTLEEDRERDRQRMTTIESSTTMLGGQIRGVGETVSRIENETKAQTTTLKALEEDKIRRDAVAQAEEKRKSRLFQMAGIALALLTAIGGGVGWLIQEREASRQQTPPAIVAPAATH